MSKTLSFLPFMGTVNWQNTVQAKLSWRIGSIFLDETLWRLRRSLSRETGISTRTYVMFIRSSERRRLLTRIHTRKLVDTLQHTNGCGKRTPELRSEHCMTSQSSCEKKSLAICLNKIINWHDVTFTYLFLIEKFYVRDLKLMAS